jgi:hypothetical protein
MQNPGSIHDKPMQKLWQRLRLTDAKKLASRLDHMQKYW